MNRSYIVLVKVKDLTEIAPLNRLNYAESNSPSEDPRLSGRPEIKEFIKTLLKMLPSTYDKNSARELVNEVVDEVMTGKGKLRCVRCLMEYDITDADEIEGKYYCPNCCINADRVLLDEVTTMKLRELLDKFPRLLEYDYEKDNFKRWAIYKEDGERAGKKCKVLKICFYPAAFEILHNF